jgi:hypothetical protein
VSERTSFSGDKRVTPFCGPNLPKGAQDARDDRFGWDRVCRRGRVLLTFCQKRVIPLRLAALGSNLAFLPYGLVLGLTPVWLLHAILLPVKAGRLVEALQLKQIGPCKITTQPGGSRGH